MKNIHAGEDSSEDRVFAIELCGGRVGDEKLSAAGIGSRVDHGDHARTVECQRWKNLSDQIIARVAFAGSAGVTGLREEGGDHAMESDVVVPAILRKINK